MWLLQALCGVETLPSALVLRPWVSESEPPIGHPGIPTLLEAGVLVDDESVHPTVAGWLETLGAPDIVLAATVRRGDSHMRLAVARRGTKHVAASQCGDDVTIEEVPRIRSMRDLVPRILPLCGPTLHAAQFAPITVPSSALLERLAQVVRGDHTPAKALGSLGLDVDQREIVMSACDSPLMEASFAVIFHDGQGAHVTKSSAAITDTVKGRIVTGPVRGEDGRWWTEIVPGTADAAARALRSLVATVGGRTWETHNRLK
ncbi:ESX secretion-associated protein EspG [Mycolicibacterium goodii]|nr:ESX secretion-associated protein EspG [Mycolicibacterium goodii]